MRLVRQRDELKQVTKLAEDLTSLTFHELKNLGRFYSFFMHFLIRFASPRLIPGARFILHTRAQRPIGQRRRGFNLANKI